MPEQSAPGSLMNDRRLLGGQLLIAGAAREKVSSVSCLLDSRLVGQLAGDSRQAWTAMAQHSRIANVGGHVVAGGQQITDDQPTDLSGRAEDGDVHAERL
jgi:hypothetical protein